MGQVSWCLLVHLSAARGLERLEASFCSFAAVSCLINGAQQEF